MRIMKGKQYIAYFKFNVIHSCMTFSRERERETERDRQTDRQTDRERERERADRDS